MEINQRPCNHEIFSDPAADTIMQVISGARNLKVLMHAIEIGIFDEMEASGDAMAAASIARKFNFDKGVTEKFLNTLVSLQLLRKEKRKGAYMYSNTAGTTKYLTRSRRATLIATAMTEYNVLLPLLEKLQDTMKTGKAALDIKQIKNIKLINDATPKASKEVTETNGFSKSPSKQSMDCNSMIMLAMDGLTVPCASVLVTAFDLSAHRTAVDLGGGSGLIGREMNKIYPEMNVIVFDFPHVVQLAAKLYPDNTSGQITFQAGDFFVDEIPTADLYILSHVVHDMREQQIYDLLEIIFKKLPPGGSLLIMEKILNEQKDGPFLAISNDLVMSLLSQGKERSAVEYLELLEGCGFTNVRVRKLAGYNYSDVILSKKPF